MEPRRRRRRRWRRSSVADDHSRTLHDTAPDTPREPTAGADRVPHRAWSSGWRGRRCWTLLKGVSLPVMNEETHWSMVRGLTKPGDLLARSDLCHLHDGRAEAESCALDEKLQGSGSGSWPGPGRTSTCGWSAGRCPRSSTAACCRGSDGPREKPPAGTPRPPVSPPSRSSARRHGAPR